MRATVLFLILGLAATSEARSTGPCLSTSKLFTKCADLIKEPRVMCAGYLSSPYAESEYMDCMRNTMDYSKYINTNTNTNDICRNAIRIDRPPTNN